ncbi:MAG: type II secretion system F family protein [Nitratireductor sp.]
MLGSNLGIIAFMALAGLGSAGILYAILYDRVSNENKQAKRVQSIRETNGTNIGSGNDKNVENAKRRKKMQEALKELDDGKAKKETLQDKIAQAGMSTPLPKFYLYSVICGVVVTILALLSGGGLKVAGAAFFVGLLGLPRWFVNFKRKRRFAAFLNEFPNAVDIIVRGVRAGLPLNECLGIISREAKEPISTEFQKVMDAQKVGLPTNEAIKKLYENVPLAEANFFAIVIAIQSSAGGNLSEALGNLANVLRDRKKMKAKVQAMSAEAKASGGIIGCLPFFVGGIVYLTSPDYIMILFTHPTGNLILLGSGIWMAMGVMVMKNMINFDF